MQKMIMLILFVLLAGSVDARIPQRGDYLMVISHDETELLTGNVTDVWGNFLCLNCTEVTKVESNLTTANKRPVDICISMENIGGLVWY
jgi:hypothetical protein